MTKPIKKKAVPKSEEFQVVHIEKDSTVIIDGKKYEAPKTGVYRLKGKSIKVIKEGE